MSPTFTCTGKLRLAADDDDEDDEDVTSAARVAESVSGLDVLVTCDESE